MITGNHTIAEVLLNLFNFIAALASIIGLAITWFTFCKTQDVEQAVRELRRTQIDRDVYLPQFRMAYYFLKGVQDSLKKPIDPDKKTALIKISEIENVHEFPQRLAVLEHSFQNQYNWFSDASPDKRDEKLRHMRENIKNIRAWINEERLTEKQWNDFSSAVSELILDLEIEIIKLAGLRGLEAKRDES